MHEEVIKEAKTLLAIIADGKKYTEAKDMHSLFADAESIMGALAYLIGPKLNAEQAYRQLIVTYMTEGDSHAKSEAKAKASDEYKNWKKLEEVYALGQEQIMLLKKFKTDLEMEYKNS